MATLPRTEHRVARSLAETADPQEAPGEGLPGRVWLSGEAAWVPDVQDDASFPRACVTWSARASRPS